MPAAVALPIGHGTMDRRSMARVRGTALIASGAFALVACTANDDLHPPAIGAITPARASPGAAVTISGHYFCGQPEPDDPDDVDPLACEHIGQVTFGALPAPMSQYTDSTVVAEVPDAPQ